MDRTKQENQIILLKLQLAMAKEQQAKVDDERERERERRGQLNIIKKVNGKGARMRTGVWSG